jgi:lipoprotein-anchoring transpeptidase ErfK/SrfK
MGIMRIAACAALAVLTASCRVDVGDDETPDGQQAPPPTTQPVQPVPGQQPQGNLQIEVDIGARQLHVIRGGQRAESHSVAVGSSEWPTQTGEWQISQVVFNPEWVPPDEEWARDEERKAPGDPENPLGRVQLVYDPPRTIHGTNQPESIGQAVSHGSIRVTNEVALQLARQVMEAGGAQRDENFFRQVEQDRSRREVVQLQNPVPIRVMQGSGTAPR